jgi:hypothetical protein
MAVQAVVAVRTQHQARPGRRAIVVADLASLCGPARGTVELDRGILISLWPSLRLPAGVRRAWEELHPALRSSGGA